MILYFLLIYINNIAYIDKCVVFSFEMCLNFVFEIHESYIVNFIGAEVKIHTLICDCYSMPML